MNRYALHTAEKVTDQQGDQTAITPDLPANVPTADFPNGAGNIDPLKSYTDMFNGTTYPIENKELIWGKYSDAVREYTRQSFPIYMGGYNAMCLTQKVVDAYQKVEDTVIGGYTKIEDAFVDRYLTKEGESVEEAKARLKREQNARQ